MERGWAGLAGADCLALQGEQQRAHRALRRKPRRHPGERRPHRLGAQSPTIGAPGTTGTTTAADRTTGAQGSNDAAGVDKKFAKQAMEGGLAEVHLGQMAAQKGNSEDVKQFGQQMVDDRETLSTRPT